MTSPGLRFIATSGDKLETSKVQTIGRMCSTASPTFSLQI
jgi:hypothetical protein